MSPTVVLGKKYAQLHIPVKESVLDTRAAKERIESKENICAVHFSNSDNFAVCCVYGGNGSTQKILFIRGGRQYVHRSKSLLNRIRKNMKLMGKRFDWKGCNRKYWRHIYNLGEYYAHRVSKEIINFCGENNVKVIAIAKIAEDAPWYKKRVGVYSPAYLSKRIMRYLQYKAWKKGIVISSVRPHYTAKKCNVCRNYIKRQRKEFSCPQGHRGNYGLNAAKNIGKMCLKKFGYQISSEGA